MIRKITAFLTGGEVVWLCDFDGDAVKRIAYKTRRGLIAHRMPLGIRPVLLVDDNKVFSIDGVTETYVKRWYLA